jgi:hypothetical protein
MEEAPKIERLITSRGITLSDAASILSSYVAIIDSAASPHKMTSPAFDHNDNDASTPDTNQANNHSTELGILSPRQRQEQNEERETGRLLAKLNQLDPASSNNLRYFGGSISDDVYERLHMIMKSMVGEAEGKPVSAVKVYNNSNNNDDGDNNVVSSEAADAEKEQNGEQLEENHGEDAFMKELEEAEQQRLLVEATDDDDKSPEEDTSQSMQQVDYEQKKKDKKAKKAAKKAKKEAKKRKASVGGATDEKKRMKVEED